MLSAHTRHGFKDPCVAAAHGGTVRDVMIGGRFVKWQGSPVGVDLRAIGDRALASPARVVRAGRSTSATERSSTHVLAAELRGTADAEQLQ